MTDGDAASGTAPLATAALVPAGHAPDRPRLRGWFHAVAAVLFPVAGAWVVAQAPTAAERRPALVFVLGMSSVFVVSSSFHLGPWTGTRYRTMRRLDHSTNALAIAAAYTPFIAHCFAGTAEVALLVACWTLALLAVASRVIWIDAPARVAAGTYLGLGWVGIVLLPFVATRIDGTDLALALLGAALVTAGAVAYALGRPNPWPRWFGHHELFHLSALAGQCLLLYVVWRLFGST